ncbi:hypothetical protein DPMN_163538 [Dreissena polymorpha]|uniref:Uncharacterized protein n=1 Tax=Dreissena polymorpha TaxID=45954 RepID=A0A9D4IV95_DREPO|nr:hypothetical protein DPMN_163538 [Dreissena polymorpha]
MSASYLALRLTYGQNTKKFFIYNEAGPGGELLTQPEFPLTEFSPHVIISGLVSYTPTHVHYLKDRTRNP